MNPNFLQTSTGTGEKTKSKSGSVQRFGLEILSRTYTAAYSVLPENIQCVFVSLTTIFHWNPVKLYCFLVQVRFCPIICYFSLLFAAFCFSYSFIFLTFSFSCLFCVLLHSSNNINKDAWPSLQPMGKTPNGLPELRKSPPLDGGSDCEHLTPDGPDSELGLRPLPALSPFSSNCEPARYKNDNDRTHMQSVWSQTDFFQILQWLYSGFVYLCFCIWVENN